MIFQAVLDCAKTDNPLKTNIKQARQKGLMKWLDPIDGRITKDRSGLGLK